MCQYCKKIALLGGGASIKCMCPCHDEDLVFITEKVHTTSGLQNMKTTKIYRCKKCDHAIEVEGV